MLLLLLNHLKLIILGNLQSTSSLSSSRSCNCILLKVGPTNLFNLFSLVLNLAQKGVNLKPCCPNFNLWINLSNRDGQQFRATAQIHHFFSIPTCCNINQCLCSWDNLMGFCACLKDLNIDSPYKYQFGTSTHICTMHLSRV